MGQCAGGLKEKATIAAHRSLSEYFFCSEFRPKIKATNPGISNVDVVKTKEKQQQLSETPNSLSSREKQPCSSKVVRQRETYKKDDLRTSQRQSHGKKGLTEFVHKKVKEQDEERQQEEGGKTTILFGLISLSQSHIDQLASNS